MRVSVDRAACQGHAMCHMLDSGLFPIDDLGYSALEDTEVGQGEEERVRHAVNACPERALSVRA